MNQACAFSLVREFTDCMEFAEGRLSIEGAVVRVQLMCARPANDVRLLPLLFEERSATTFESIDEALAWAEATKRELLAQGWQLSPFGFEGTE